MMTTASIAIPIITINRYLMAFEPSWRQSVSKLYGRASGISHSYNSTHEVFIIHVEVPLGTDS